MTEKRMIRARRSSSACQQKRETLILRNTISYQFPKKKGSKTGTFLKTLKECIHLPIYWMQSTHAVFFLTPYRFHGSNTDGLMPSMPRYTHGIRTASNFQGCLSFLATPLPTNHPTRMESKFLMGFNMCCKQLYAASSFQLSDWSKGSITCHMKRWSPKVISSGGPNDCRTPDLRTFPCDSAEQDESDDDEEDSQFGTISVETSSNGSSSTKVIWGMPNWKKCYIFWTRIIFAKLVRRKWRFCNWALSRPSLAKGLIGRHPDKTCVLTCFCTCNAPNTSSLP